MSSPVPTEGDIRLIVQSVVREQIDREREFIGTTFRAALGVAGISLTVVATAGRVLWCGAVKRY
jgi:hypothetical protein